MDHSVLQKLEVTPPLPNDVQRAPPLALSLTGMSHDPSYRAPPAVDVRRLWVVRREARPEISLLMLISMIDQDRVGCRRMTQKSGARRWTSFALTCG